MSKFGDLVGLDIPILLDFYNDDNQISTVMHPILRDVAAAVGDKGKVIKINVDKNNEYYQKVHDELSKKYGVEELTVAQLGGIECAKCHY